MWLLIERQEDYQDYYVLRGVYSSAAEAMVDNYEDDRSLAVAETFFGEVDIEELAQPELDRKHAKYQKQLMDKEQEIRKAVLSGHSGHAIQEINKEIVCLTCVKVYSLNCGYKEKPAKTFNRIRNENNRRRATQASYLEEYKKRLGWLRENQSDSGLIPYLESVIEGMNKCLR